MTVEPIKLKPQMKINNVRESAFIYTNRIQWSRVIVRSNEISAADDKYCMTEIFKSKAIEATGTINGYEYIKSNHDRRWD